MRWLKVVGLAAVVAVACAAGAAAQSTSQLAATLAERDPGSRIGANTQVTTRDGARVHGVPRQDFVMALGDRQTIDGRGGTDYLGSRGRNATIRGGTGNDHLYGGPGATLVGGRGADLMVGTGAGVTFRVAAGDYVIAAGRRGRILCAADVKGAVIIAGRDDRVDPACRRNGATIRRPGPQGPLRSLQAPRPAQVSGDGSNGNPFVAPCDDPADDPCTVSSFAARLLTGLWANEFVPAYACPADHPWLVNTKYAPAFTVIPNGVDVQEQLPWAIGISISGMSWHKPIEAGPPNRFHGTLTGYPNSSATSWSLGTHAYRIILHCTATCDLGYDLTGSHPCVGAGASERRLGRGREGREP
jgi:hypothetical protein